MQKYNISNPRIDGTETEIKPKKRNVDHTLRIRQIISWLIQIFIRKKPSWNQFYIQKASIPKPDKGFVGRRRRNPSRSRSTDGMPIRQACGRNNLTQPKFDVIVEKNGYACWCVDGISIS